MEYLHLGCLKTCSLAKYPFCSDVCLLGNSFYCRFVNSDLFGGKAQTQRGAVHSSLSLLHVQCRNLRCTKITSLSFSWSQNGAGSTEKSGSPAWCHPWSVAELDLPLCGFYAGQASYSGCTQCATAHAAEVQNVFVSLTARGTLRHTVLLSYVYWCLHAGNCPFSWTDHSNDLFGNPLLVSIGKRIPGFQTSLSPIVCQCPTMP